MSPLANPILVFVSGILSFFLLLFQIMLWVYLIVSVVRSVKPDWRPSGAVLLGIDLTHRVVDRPLRGIRKLIPPLELGAIRLDLAWMILLFATIILRQIVGGIPGMA